MGIGIFCMYALKPDKLEPKNKETLCLAPKN